MPAKLKVFISSRMMELAEERQILSGLLPELGDNSFELETWVFEDDALASSQSIRQVYLDALEQSDLYLGIFWNGYGEYTIDEFNRAEEGGIPRHVYVKNIDAEQRDPRLDKFLEKASDVRFGVTPRWYQSAEEFKELVSRAVQVWLQNQALAYHSSTNVIIASDADDVPDLPRKLIGRKKLVSRVLNLLEDNDRVLLRGFGGTGKTALAATIAADYLDEDMGDVIWIKAGTADADSIFEAIGRAFDQQQEVLSAEGDARDHVVRKILSQHKGLLVLDDVWNGTSLARVATVLPRRMPLLATSRQRYPLDEVIEIGELESDEAIRLLDYHARKGFTDTPDIVQLCETLGNHAFALEVAGKTLKVYEMTAEELLRRIEESPHDLSVPAGFGELGRTGIKSLLDASIDALDRNLYDTYVTLGGMFEPTVTGELMSRVMAQDLSDTRSALDDLVQRGLLNDRQNNDLGYYQLHDLAYSYARTSYNSKGLSYQPILEACRDFADEYAGELPYLDIEISNLLEAAESAREDDNQTIFLSIMNALTVAGPYFAARGHTMRTLDLLRSAIDSAEKDGEIEMGHYLCAKLGNAYAGFLGQFDLALESYQKSLELARQMNNYQREAILLTVIGTIRFRQGEDDSDDYHRQAEQIARDHDDPVILCQVLHNRGGQLVNEKEADYATGRDLSLEAVQIAKEHDLTELLFSSLLNAGAGQHELGDYEDALASHQEAYQLAENVDYLDWMADSSFSMAEDTHMMNDRGATQTYLENALRYARDSGAVAIATNVTDFAKKHDYQLKE